MKDPEDTCAPVDGVLERRVADLLAGYAGPVAVMSFNPHSVAHLATAAPGVPRGLTTCAFDGPDWSLPDYRRAELAGIADFGATGAGFISHDHRDLDSPAVAALRAAGCHPLLDHPQCRRRGCGPAHRAEHHLRGL